MIGTFHHDNNTNWTQVRCKVCLWAARIVVSEMPGCFMGIPAVE